MWIPGLVKVSNRFGIDNSILKTNFQTYTKGQYGAYPGLWYLYIDPTLGLGHTAVEGVDFDFNIRVQPDTFPAGTLLTWRVPNNAPAYAGIWGYGIVTFGNYQWTTQEVEVTSRQVSSIGELSTVCDFTYTSADDSDVLEEMWLTSEARGNGQTVDAYKTHEVGAFRRTNVGTVNYMNSVTQIGTYNDGTREWTVAVDTGRATPFIMFRPTNGADVESTILWPLLWAYLIAQGRITGDEWFNGMACGTEPSLGSGTLLFSWSVTAYSESEEIPDGFESLTSSGETITVAGEPVYTEVP